MEKVGIDVNEMRDARNQDGIVRVAQPLEGNPTILIHYTRAPIPTQCALGLKKLIVCFF